MTACHLSEVALRVTREPLLPQRRTPGLKHRTKAPPTSSPSARAMRAVSEAKLCRNLHDERGRIGESGRANWPVRALTTVPRPVHHWELDREDDSLL